MDETLVWEENVGFKGENELDNYMKNADVVLIGKVPNQNCDSDGDDTARKVSSFRASQPSLLVHVHTGCR